MRSPDVPETADCPKQAASIPGGRKAGLFFWTDLHVRFLENVVNHDNTFTVSRGEFSVFMELRVLNPLRGNILYECGRTD